MKLINHPFVVMDSLLGCGGILVGWRTVYIYLLLIGTVDSSHCSCLLSLLTETWSLPDIFCASIEDSTCKICGHVNAWYEIEIVYQTWESEYWKTHIVVRISGVLHKFSFTGWFWFDIWITTMLFLTFLALVVLQSGMHGTQIKSRRGVKEVSKLSLETTLNTQLTQSWATTNSNHIPSEARERNLWYSAAG
jgi:hypothetical protein